jgi:hypothetical protein
MKSFTITLSDEQMAQLNTIHSTRQNRSVEAILDQVIERGLYNLEYRSKYNQVKIERDREDRKLLKEYKEMLAKS